MKKIYMILAAITLLSMSLNAQWLPEKHKSGSRNHNYTGMAYLYTPNNQFRMPSLNNGEYLFGPYLTDDFDATGASLYNLYNQAQDLTVVVDMLRSEFEEHLGDSIIGFRFALAGSSPVRVYDFGAYFANDEEYAGDDDNYTWNLGQIVAGNTNTETQTTTVTGPVDVTFTSANSATNTLTNNEVTITTGINELGGYAAMYLNGTTTISTTNGTITKIVFNGNNNTYYPVSRLSAATGNFTVSNNVGTWTGSASSVSFSSTQDAGCSSIVVTVERTTTQTVNVNTVTVGRGTIQDEELPAYGFWHDMGYKNQMIYRAEQLAMSSGAQITAITYYPEEGIGIPFGGSTVTVSLANTSSENFGTGTTGNMITSGFTTVATIVPVEDETVTAWTINFTTPFTYTGGNLVVQVNSPGNGDFGHCYFYGDTQSSNVSIKVSGSSSQTATSGPTSKFLPKTTFTFTGNINTPTYMTLQPGGWHDFFLDQPVVFNAPDGYDYMSLGYTYYQQYSSSFAPVAYNSNSTGRDHWALGYGRQNTSSSYSYSWWGISSRLGGNLAVQLILKPAKQKTPPPTISVTYDNGYYYITATADPSTPNATVTLTVGGQTATSEGTTGTVTIPVGRIYGQDQTVQASATALETGMLVSDPTNQTITVLASPLEPTPTPSIDSQVLDATVEVTGIGQGDVILYINGQKVTNPYYLERTDELYTVTVTVTAQINDDEHSMSTYTTTVDVPPLTNIDLEGWERLPGTYANNKVINWNDNLMFVDRFTASTANNNQPTQYKYVMTEDPIKLIGQPRRTNEHTILVQTTKSKVFGFFTENDVLADRDRQHVDTCVMNAEVELNVEKKSTIYYYTLDRSRNSREDANFLELTELQFDGNRYTEQDDFYTLHEPFYFVGDATSRTINRFDTIEMVLPTASAPQGNEKGEHFGKYGKDYFAYVPIVWTWGNNETNMRAFWDRDSVHNSYGSPVWQSSVGKVQLGQLQIERQVGKHGSTNWNEINGTDTTKCSLFMVKSLRANGFLPMKHNGTIKISNIEYEPYMFRVWVTSPTGKLRKYTRVAGNGTTTGDHYVGAGTIPADSICWIWDQPADVAGDFITFTNDSVTTFNFWKQEEWEHQSPGNPNDSTWVLPEEVNMIFAAPDDITADDIKIIVRFYYRSTGRALNQNLNSKMFMSDMRDGDGDGDGRGYYGVENPGGDNPDPRIPTCIRNVYDLTQERGEVVDVTYVNLQGMRSSKPFDGINIVVTRYSNGSVTTTKVLR
jgi:hypothetical protein